MKALKITIIALLAGFSMASCDFLDKEPTKLTPENYFNTPAEANSFLTGVYAILSQPTFYGGDYMYLVAGDDLSHYGGSGRGPASTGLICNNATTSDNAVTAFWYALYSGINRANMFLENIDKVTGFDSGVKEQYIAEARFLRALSYEYALDLYRNVPFVDENSPIGSIPPKQIMAADLFNWIEKELTECVEDMLEPAVGYNQDYGHANKAAAWALLSRLYLNAETYVGLNKYTECITYAKKVIEVGYQLEPVYVDMFKADNHLSNEMIFPVRYEGDQTMTWGGMTAFLCWGATATQDEVNAKGAWQGVRAKSSLYNLFLKESGSDADTRKAMLRTDLTTSIEIIDENTFQNNGIPVTKYFNVNKDGTLPPSKEAYVDFPLFRLGEIYLTYAEAVLRGGQGGDRATALRYVNDLRKRAYSDKTLAPISDSDLTLNFIIDERGREFFFEGQRRTDLVRFGLFTTAGYVWPWKGGAAKGKAVENFYNVFPIPSDDIGSNTNLKQNEGY